MALLTGFALFGAILVIDSPSELSDLFGNARFGGAGLATEAAQALFEYLFAGKDARRLFAYVEEDNVASQRLCEKLGMRHEGTFKEFISFENDSYGRPVFVNTRQYAILRKEWLQ